MSIYTDAFPAEMRDHVKKNREAMKKAGKAYVHAEDASDAALVYMMGVMNGPDAAMLDDPMVCMAISRVFRNSPKSEWAKYETMNPSELVALDARMNGA